MPLLRYTSRCGRRIGDRPSLVRVGQIPDDGRRAPVDESVEDRQPLSAAGVDDHLVTVAEHGLSGGSA
jgi:hypothetical protein